MKNPGRLVVGMVSFCLLIQSVSSQFDGQILALYNPAPGVFQFVRYDPATDEMVIVNDLPFTSISTVLSASFDPIDHRYFLCTGTELWTLDPSGLTDPMMMELPVPPGATFLQVQYDQCTGMLIGVMNAYPASMSVSKYDPQLNLFSYLAEYPSIYVTSAETTLDIQARRYYLPLMGQLYVYDIDNGGFTSIPVQSVGEEIFGHIAVDCRDGLIYGTSAGVQAWVKFLSTVDPESGLVEHVSSASTSHGVFKPAGGGSCIDHTSNYYYWSGAGGLIVQASLETGEVVDDPVPHAGEFFLVQCYTSCVCGHTGEQQLEPSRLVSVVWHQPFLEIISNDQRSLPSMLRIHDGMGRLTFQQQLHGSHSYFELSDLMSGSYVYTITGNANERMLTGKLVKVN